MYGWDHIKSTNLDQQLKKGCWKKKGTEEFDLQCACVEWFDKTYPEMRLYLHHSPNEAKRSERQGHQLKLMGMRAGFPDLMLLIPCGEHPFMALELKTRKGKMSDTQKTYRDALAKVKAVHYTIRTIDEFREAINKYLEESQWQVTG